MKSTLTQVLQHTIKMSAFQTANTTTVIERFDASVFKNADEAGQQQQLINWVKGEGASVYVQWVPDELTEAGAINYFTRYGIVDRVEFVPKFDQDREKQIGRMMFVHMVRWTNEVFADDIAKVHPQAATAPLQVSNRFGIPKGYILKMRVNTRPITKVEYNASQLTDMFENLNKRFTTEMKALKEENAKLRTDVDRLTIEVADLIINSQS